MSYAKASSSRLGTGSAEPAPQLSLPPSPIDEQDLGGASLWSDDEHEQDELDDEPPESQFTFRKNEKGKGKGKANGFDNGADVDGTEMHYPPLKEEEEESKKIEENLRRWEHAERQRRKTAREREKNPNMPSTYGGGSVIGDVSRRASTLLFSSKRGSLVTPVPTTNTAPKPRGQGHTALHRASEDTLTLHDINEAEGDGNGGGEGATPTSPGATYYIPGLAPSPGASKPGSPEPDRDRSRGRSTSGAIVHAPIPTISIVENPFEPPGSATPLRGFGDDVEDENWRMEKSAVMNPSSPPVTPAARPEPEKSPFDDPLTTQLRDKDRRPTLQATSSFSGPGVPSHPLAPPPPMPLDLPPPKTPPPRTPAPGAKATVSTPPRKVPEPSSARRRENDEEQEGEEEGKRWWTDWLCGCRESGRDGQAGRTNPFE